VARYAKMARNPDWQKNLKPGNKRGPAKVTMALKEAILKAAEQAGGEGGTVGYLANVAVERPEVFVPLLSKLLPAQSELTGKNGGPIETQETGQGAAKVAAFLDAIASRTTGDPAAG